MTVILWLLSYDDGDFYPNLRPCGIYSSKAAAIDAATVALGGGRVTVRDDEIEITVSAPRPRGDSYVVERFDLNAPVEAP